MSDRLKQLASVSLAAFLAVPLLGLGVGQTSADYVFIFVEDFDGAWPPKFYALEPVPGSWRVADNNAASGMDYWGRSSARAYGGTYSAWCAQNGVNSVNSVSNSINGYYDQDMQACMAVYLGNIQGYETLAFGFRYWAETGTSTVNDYLEVRVFDGESWSRVWMQPDVGTMAWESVGIEIPNTTTWLGFFFMSDAEVGLGPYEGVYVDNIILGGNDVDAPSSAAGPLEEYWVGDTVYIPYSVSDSFGSGVEYVELYYRRAGATAYEKYALPDSPEGRWESALIPFNTSLVGGDGRYEFYTIATDSASNVELAPGSPDAYAIVDNLPPETEAVIIDDEGLYGWYSSSVSAMLWAADNLSGVSKTWYRIGDGDWQMYDAGLTVDSEGLNELQFYSEDNAGNREQTRFARISVDSQAPELTVTGPEDGAEFDVGSVLVSWDCSDDTSGIHHVTVTVDARRSEYCNSTAEELLMTNLDGGVHEIVITAYDLAGNSAQETFDVTVAGEEEEEEAEGDGKWSMLAIAALIAAIAAFVAVILLALSIARERRGRRLEPPGGQPTQQPPMTAVPEAPPPSQPLEESPPPTRSPPKASASRGSSDPDAGTSTVQPSGEKSSQPEPMRSSVESAPATGKPAKERPPKK